MARGKISKAEEENINSFLAFFRSTNALSK